MAAAALGCAQLGCCNPALFPRLPDRLGRGHHHQHPRDRRRQRRGSVLHRPLHPWRRRRFPRRAHVVPPNHVFQGFLCQRRTESRYGRNASPGRRNPAAELPTPPGQRLAARPGMGGPRCPGPRRTLAGRRRRCPGPCRLRHPAGRVPPRCGPEPDRGGRVRTLAAPRSDRRADGGVDPRLRVHAAVRAANAVAAAQEERGIAAPAEPPAARDHRRAQGQPGAVEPAIIGAGNHVGAYGSGPDDGHRRAHRSRLQPARDGDAGPPACADVVPPFVHRGAGGAVEAGGVHVHRRSGQRVRPQGRHPRSAA